MFLFLSKILPLFIYPLGLACVLLVIALGLGWRKSRWQWLPVLGALLVLLIASNPGVSTRLARSLEWRYLPDGELPQAEAIVLLGGATRPADPPRSMVEVTEAGDRVFYAAKLYKDGKAPLILVTGGRVHWLGGGTPEATDIAGLLEFMGIPSEAIIQEPEALNTYQNAVNTRKILSKRGIKKILLVTSALHIPRSQAIFQRQNFEVIPAPTDFFLARRDLESRQESSQSILYNLFPDLEALNITTKAIKEYMGIWVYSLRGWL
ncbi:MAG: YdcF family protein [Jaaginema sp. PMC 1080.18]|nr:YdcF family protein [Jaaginema sp. PMC 1080.18]MEC4866716.1 YdcF family protein [Jaaginema sp. PMC 1078.18]